MVSKFALGNLLLVSSVVLAIPSSQPEARLARRHENRWTTQDIELRDSASSSEIESLNSNGWSGAFWELNKGDFLSVTATINVPTPLSNGGSVKAWVGLDGHDACPHVSLQAGVEFAYDNGSLVLNAWYQWYPGNSVNVTDFPVLPGQDVTVTVTSINTTHATAYFENHTKGKISRETLNYPHYPLCQQSAGWIVEYYGEEFLPAVFADFGTISFTHATASGPYMLFTPLDAKTLSVASGMGAITSVDTGDTNVTVSYVGNTS